MVSDHYIEKGRFALRSRGEEDSPRPIMESFHKIVMKGHQAGSSLLEIKDNLDRSVGVAVQKAGPAFAESKNSIDRSVRAAAQIIDPALMDSSISAGLQKMIPSIIELKKKLDQSVGAALQKVHEFTSSDAYDEWKKQWIAEEGIDEDEDLFGIAPGNNDTGIFDYCSTNLILNYLRAINRPILCHSTLKYFQYSCGFVPCLERFLIPHLNSRLNWWSNKRMLRSLLCYSVL